MKRKLSVEAVLKLKPIIAWLRKKPAKGTYNYGDTNNCLLCQYLRSKGYRNVSAGGYFVTVNHEVFQLPKAIYDFPAPEAGPAIYGEALKRAVAAARWGEGKAHD